jgi:hypothetical protein
MKCVMLLVLGITLGCAGFMAANANAGGVAITFKNSSQWAIHNLYLSSTNQNEWGPDQLGNQVINTGGSFELQNIPVGKYDVQIVDEDGDKCILGGVKIAANEEVNITPADLLKCQAATDENSGDSDEE